MLIKLAIIFGLVFPFAGGAAAGQFIEREIPCPVCGTVFYAKLDLPASLPEIRLDLKPLGPVSGPWLLPDCPKCGFVIYRYPVPKAELAVCKGVVASEEYKKKLGRSTYFRVGLLYGKLRQTDYSVAMSFLKASWQEEAEAGKLKEDQELALKWFNACALTCGVEERENSQLLTGELLRRLGRFEEARAYLSGLQKIKGFQNNFFADIVEYQLKQCSKLDAAPHEMEEVRDFKRSPLDRVKLRLRRFLGYLADLGEKTAKDSPTGRKTLSPEAESR